MRVYKYTLDGVLISSYPSVIEAAKQNDHSSQHICNVIAGRSKTAKGYNWSYKKRPFFNTISEQIIDIVIDVTGISYEVFISKCRKREIVRARQIAQYLLKDNKLLSLAQIGILTGMQSHCNVVHSHKTILNNLETKEKIIIKIIKDCEARIEKIRNFYFKMWIPIYEHSKI